MNSKPLLIVTLVIAGGCSTKKEPSVANFTEGMNAYLAKRGDLCLSRPDWPIDVGEADREQRTRDALQLPVMEKLGVVESAPVAVQVQTDDGPRMLPVTRYQLTALGRQFYIDRQTRRPTTPGNDDAQGDLCVARVTLAKVVSWELRPTENAPTTATVSYTYRVDAAPWMKEPTALRVFPAVAQVIAGAGTAQMKEGFTLTPQGWVANELLEAGGAVATGQAPKDSHP